MTGFNAMSIKLTLSVLAALLFVFSASLTTPAAAQLTINLGNKKIQLNGGKQKPKFQLQLNQNKNKKNKAKIPYCLKYPHKCKNKLAQPSANRASHCPPPTYYSKKKRKCICPKRKGYIWLKGKCVKAPIISVPTHPGTKIPPKHCKKPLFFNKKSGRCDCPTWKGYMWFKGKCLKFPVIGNPTPPGHNNPGGGNDKKCKKPLVYSKVNEGCICPKHLGYKWINDRCVRPPVACKAPEFYSHKKGKCICPKNRGFVRIAGACVKITLPPITPPQPQPPEDDGPEITQPQPCRGNLVYSRKYERCVCPTRRGFRWINGRCRKPTRPDPTPPEVISEPETEVTEEIKPAAHTPISPANAKCLPADLYDKLTAEYGPNPNIKRCSNACLPKPDGLSEATLTKLADKHGINWCQSCIRLASFVPLADILKIEAAAGITLCGKPTHANQCTLPEPKVIVKTYTKVRTLFRRLPMTVGNDGDIAVIIGNDRFGEFVPAKTNGQRNAGAMKTLLTEQLGYKEKNIIDLRNATRADFEEIFGSADNPDGKLAQMVKARKRGDIFVYISSHGMTDKETEESYILPTDADMDQLSETAFSLNQLYTSLGRIDASSIMLLLEAGFASDLSEASDPNLPEKEVKILPASPVPGLAVFTAADRDQKTLDDPEYGIGLFTRFMIEGLAGKADEAPLGNADRRVDTVELYVFAADQVRQTARKSLGLEQKPQIMNPENAVVGRLAQK